MKKATLLVFLLLAGVLCFMGCGSGGSDEETQQTAAETEAVQTEETAASEDYDILKDLEEKENGSSLYLYGNDFLLIMPNNGKWDIEQRQPQSFTVYLKAGKTSGFEGDLVTITAYDLDDTSYEEHPHYQIAGVGRNVNKRFVATYPTDVRWDTSDPAQEADYMELKDYLDKISEGAADSPFLCADSD